MASVTTTQLGFQRTIGVADTYVAGTMLERLYKRATKAHEVVDDGDIDDGTFVLTLKVFAPTAVEIKAVQAEVDDEALSKAIETVKTTVRLSGRVRVDSRKVQLNKEAEQL